MNWTQLSGIIDRILLVILTYVASKGWINPADVAGYVTLILGVVGAIYGWYVNRPTAIIQAAEAIPAVKSVTVAATPEGKAIEAATGPKVTT